MPDWVFGLLLAVGFGVIVSTFQAVIARRDRRLVERGAPVLIRVRLAGAADPYPVRLSGGDLVVGSEFPRFDGHDGLVLDLAPAGLAVQRVRATTASEPGRLGDIAVVCADGTGVAVTVVTDPDQAQLLRNALDRRGMPARPQVVSARPQRANGAARPAAGPIAVPVLTRADLDWDSISAAATAREQAEGWSALAAQGLAGAGQWWRWYALPMLRFSRRQRRALACGPVTPARYALFLDLGGDCVLLLSGEAEAARPGAVPEFAVILSGDLRGQLPVAGRAVVYGTFAEGEAVAVDVAGARLPVESALLAISQDELLDVVNASG